MNTPEQQRVATHKQRKFNLVIKARVNQGLPYKILKIKDNRLRQIVAKRWKLNKPARSIFG